MKKEREDWPREKLLVSHGTVDRASKNCADVLNRTTSRTILSPLLDTVHKVTDRASISATMASTSSSASGKMVLPGKKLSKMAGCPVQIFSRSVRPSRRAQSL